MGNSDAGRDDKTAAAELGAPADLFDLVTDRYAGMITRIALAHEGDPAIRRDLVQEIMLAVWAALPRFRRESSLKTFVAGIAYKRSITHVARAVRRPRSAELSESLASPDPLPDEVASRNQLKARLLEAVQALPLAQRQAIILFLEDFSFREIGETLGISAHAAEMRCHRARAILRDAMERWS
jgi:RNA polymerase sigma-70 factor, ECF subfamily